MSQFASPKRIFVISIGIVFCWLSIANICLAERLAVRSGVANIRSGPGTNYAVLWQVEKYHPLNIIKKKGNWCKFKDFEGDTGWISRGLVGKIKAVITKKNKNNIRSGPSTKYRILFTAERGIPFKVLSRKGNWIRIQHADGDKGWIYKSLVW